MLWQTKEGAQDGHGLSATHHDREELNWMFPEVQFFAHISEYELLLLNDAPNHPGYQTR